MTTTLPAPVEVDGPTRDERFASDLRYAIGEAVTPVIQAATDRHGLMPLRWSPETGTAVYVGHIPGYLNHARVTAEQTEQAVRAYAAAFGGEVDEFESATATADAVYRSWTANIMINGIPVTAYGSAYVAGAR